MLEVNEDHAEHIISLRVSRPVILPRQSNQRVERCMRIHVHKGPHAQRSISEFVCCCVNTVLVQLIIRFIDSPSLPPPPSPCIPCPSHSRDRHGAWVILLSTVVGAIASFYAVIYITSHDHSADSVDASRISVRIALRVCDKRVTLR